jgi:cyclase
VYKKTEVDAALAASLFHFNKAKLKEVKKYLEKNNILVRP